MSHIYGTCIAFQEESLDLTAEELGETREYYWTLGIAWTVLSSQFVILAHATAVMGIGKIAIAGTLTCPDWDCANYDCD